MYLDSDNSEDFILPKEFEIIEIMRYMNGWSCKDYESAPKKLIDHIRLKMSTENSFADWKNKNSKKPNARRFK